MTPRRRTLSQDDRALIKRYLVGTLDNLEWDIIDLMPQSTRDSVTASVTSAMAAEGKTFHRDPLAGNLYGTERANRVREAMMRTFRGELDKLRPRIVRLCNKVDYCDRRSTEGANVAFAVADAIVSMRLQTPLPIATLSSYLVKKGVLNDWCHCAT